MSDPWGSALNDVARRRAIPIALKASAWSFVAGVVLGAFLAGR